MEEKLVVSIGQESRSNSVEFYVIANNTRVSGFYQTRSNCWQVADKLLRRWGVTLPSFGERTEDGIKRRNVVKRYVFSWNLREKKKRQHDYCTCTVF